MDYSVSYAVVGVTVIGSYAVVGVTVIGSGALERYEGRV
jgi:hypothetical protein